ncbi:MAG: HD domain-containing response regulator [Bacillota bacterium]|nr:HD domain-containing response regulator [Bacillota bacterium]
MRLATLKKNEAEIHENNFKIIGLDDEAGVIKTLKVILERSGYEFKGYTNHTEAIEELKKSHFDLLILDYLLDNINGSQVVEIIRSFNKELYILLLTGHSECAPPLETLEKNEIQGYCAKSDDSSQLMLLIKSAYKSIAMMNEIKMTRNGLSNILKAAPQLFQLQPIDVILEYILLNLLEIVESKDAFILADNIVKEDSEKETYYRGVGKFNTDINTFTTMFSPLHMMYAGTARMQHKTVSYESGVFFPLLNDRQESIGVIYVELDDHKKLDILEIYANQAASSINNAFLHSLLSIKNNELNKTYEIIKTRYEETIDTLRLAVDAKDEYTRGHSDRVAKYSVQIGKCFSQLKENDLALLNVGGTFHDIGKIGTADDILLSDRKLNDLEYQEIKKHPLNGAKILSALSMFNEIVPLVMYHHERIDGKGYPNGLKGDEIPFLARILSVADAFDAMTTNRVYRQKLSLEDAIAQLEKGSGTQFDTVIVEKFAQLLKSKEIEID